MKSSMNLLNDNLVLMIISGTLGSYPFSFKDMPWNWRIISVPQIPEPIKGWMGEESTKAREGLKRDNYQ